MTNEELFLFDLQGYLVLEDVLTPSQVAAANEAVDRHVHLIQNRKAGLAHTSRRLSGSKGKAGFGQNPLSFESPWSEPFRQMLVHPRVVDIFNEILGAGFRLDHGPALLQMDQGVEGHWLHGGMTFDPSRYHRYEHGRIYCGLCVASWQLTEIRHQDGGFVCIPGSHKLNYRAPDRVLSAEDDRGLIKHLDMRPASLLIFNEALLHGTLPWTADNRVRRAILFKYSPGFLSWAKPHDRCPIMEPTAEELALYEPTYRSGRPTLGEGQEDRAAIHAHPHRAYVNRDFEA
jgi:ectoine hydroxylase-related dioxygenase (phytanoyl-CoA dioxygenase family)